MQPNVFEFQDPVSFLNAAFGELQSQNPRFSLRAWSEHLGLSHVAMLSMVMNRKRRLLPPLASKVSAWLLQKGKLDETSARYFEMLVLFNNAKTLEEKTFYERLLSSLRPDRKFSTIDLDQLRLVSDWHHFAILEMTALKDFNSDPRWIRLRLGGCVNEGQVLEAIERLLRLGLLERTEDGSLRKSAQKTATPTDLPSGALRRLHSQMIDRAKTALETQTVEERDITAHMLVTSRAKLPEAKRMIREFRTKLAEFLETPGGDALYQVNIQLFDLLKDCDGRPACGEVLKASASAGAEEVQS